MTTAVIIMALVIIGGVYLIAKQRGAQKKALEIMDQEEALDREEADAKLDDKRDSNAWDNLNDTIDDIGKR